MGSLKQKIVAQKLQSDLRKLNKEGKNNRNVKLGTTNQAQTGQKTNFGRKLTVSLATQEAIKKQLQP